MLNDNDNEIPEVDFDSSKLMFEEYFEDDFYPDEVEDDEDNKVEEPSDPMDHLFG